MVYTVKQINGLHSETNELFSQWNKQMVYTVKQTNGLHSETNKLFTQWNRQDTRTTVQRTQKHSNTGCFKIKTTHSHKSNTKNYRNTWKSIFILKYYKYCWKWRPSACVQDWQCFIRFQKHVFQHPAVDFIYFFSDSCF